MGASVDEVVEPDEREFATVADRLGKYDAGELGSMGDTS